MKVTKLIITAILVLLIIATIGGIVYLSNIPNPNERFTEFYILGPDGKAENYPSKVTLGTGASIIVGIVNHEQGMASYQMVVRDELGKNLVIKDLKLDDEEKWQQSVFFSPVAEGNNQKIEFLLFKNQSRDPYLTLRCWIDVVK